MSDLGCITSQCGLCQFNIAQGDEIAIYQSGKWERLIARTLDLCAICDGMHCTHPDGLAIGCHSDCLRLVALDHSYRLIEATKHTFRVSAEEKQRRQNWLLSCLVSELCKGTALSEGRGHKPQLPPEIWRSIAGELLHYYAVEKAGSLWTPPQHCHITLDRAVWRRFVEFEGRRYISSLSNCMGPQYPELLFSPSSSKTINCLYVQEDHLGITDVLFSSSSEEPTVDNIPGIWWRTVRLAEKESVVQCESDGIKLRSLLSADQTSIAWSVIPPKNVRFHHFGHRAQPTPKRMTALICNGPHTIGYSILWSSGLMLIHAHKAGEDLSFYHSAPHTSWLYMPVDHDEVITEIYQGHGWLGRDNALGIKTNKGRCFFAGIYLKNAIRRWTLVDKPSQTPSRIFYENSDTSIGVLAFDSQCRPINGQLFSLPKQPSPNLIFVAQEDYFYTSCDLTNLAEITPCRLRESGEITGLLLRFTNGHHDNVGQARLDSLSKVLEIGEKQTAFLGFRRRNGRHPYVAGLAGAQSELGSNFDAVIEIFSGGRLEWFWSHRQCQVIYDGQKSPCTL